MNLNRIISIIICLLLLSCNSKDNSTEFIEKTSGRYLFNSDEVVEVYFNESELYINWRGAKKIKPLKVNDNTFFVKEMNEKTDKKFYWVEGVTKKEVINSLNDNKPSIFRNQRNRRILVALTSVCIVFLGLVIFIEHPKLKSYVEICLIAIVLLVYLPMRKSVRHIADAPNELLDERQIALRNNAYLFAYRGMLYVALIYVVVYY